MIQLKVTVNNGDSATWTVDRFIISEGVLTYWVVKTNEEINLDMDDIEEISVFPAVVVVGGTEQPY